MQSPTLDSLQAAVARFRDEREWKQFHSPKDLALSLSIEAAELLQLVQWKGEAATRAELASPQAEAFADELADCLYYVLLMAHDWGLDLGTAFHRKLAKNAARYPVDKARGNARKYTEL